ncbi:MAG: hypothetical protein RSG77_17850 [Hafnia sp.]
MKNFAVSIDDIEQALEYTSKDILAKSIALDTLGAGAIDTEQFSRHLAAYKNQHHNALVEACKPLVLKHSTSITASKGCFLDAQKTIAVDFEGALKANLENLVASLDSALTGSNPAASMISARTIVADWSQAKLGGISKGELSNGDLSIVLNLGSKAITISPDSKVDETKLMEASPILNELSESISLMITRRAGRDVKAPSFGM